ITATGRVGCSVLTATRSSVAPADRSWPSVVHEIATGTVPRPQVPVEGATESVADADSPGARSPSSAPPSTVQPAGACAPTTRPSSGAAVVFSTVTVAVAAAPGRTRAASTVTSTATAASTAHRV